MELVTGQIIKASVNRFPLIKHFGIVLVWNNEYYVMHHSPGQGLHITSNQKPKIELLSDYLTLRTLQDFSNSILMEMDVDAIVERQQLICDYEYNLFSQNCEHFINCMVGEKSTSPQIARWALAGAAAYFTYRK